MSVFISNQPRFQVARLWEQNVVLEVNVLMKILFECGKRIIQCPITDARFRRSRIVASDVAKLLHKPAHGLMLHHHHAYRKRRGGRLSADYADYADILKRKS